MQQPPSDHSETRRRRLQLQDQMVVQAQSSAQRGRTEDSWIEVSSQPSPSLLYPVANNGIGSNRMSTRSASVAGSSQDEYAESESESDQVMSSSNEDLSKPMDDEDDTSTALGVSRTTQHVFTPQPNAFSHPPMSNNVQSAPAPDSYFPPAPRVISSDRLPSYRTVAQRTIRQEPSSRIHLGASRSQPDHDAALRASLTTLLSCAAAVRPKQTDIAADARPAPQPRSFRLVPESELDTSIPKPLPRRRSRESSKERQAKKVRAIRAATTSDDLVSPTMMTWMISAGVVLVVSAISFSAGYAWGKDAGTLEGEFSCTSCGKEVMRTNGGSGLRKLRWTPAAQSIRA